MKSIAACFFILVSFSLFGQTKSEQLDSIFTLLHENDRFNGCILIAEEGEPIFNKAYGYSDFEGGLQLSTNSIFKLNSVTKQFTAFGIIQLMNQVKLDLDDNLAKHLPELSFYEDVTIRHLLNHTHGIPDYDSLFLALWDLAQIATNNDIVELYKKHSPSKRFKAGDQFNYGGIGYELLAVVIERISNQSYSSFLAENIFDPLEMDNTFDFARLESTPLGANMVVGYVFDENLGRRERVDLLPQEVSKDWSNGIYGSGNIHSTTADLLKWDRALRDTGFVSRADSLLLFSPTTLNDGSEINYGFGWWLLEKESTGKIVSHAGNSGGFETHYERHLDSDKTIIILQNFDATTPAIDAIDAILYNQPFDIVLVRKEIELTEEQLMRFVGSYALNENIGFDVFVENGQLFAQLSGQSAIQLRPETENTFFVKKVDVQFEFSHDSTSDSDTMIIFQNGNRMEARKVVD